MIKPLLALLMIVAAAACVAAIGMFALISLLFMGIFIGAIHLAFLTLGGIKGWFFG